MAKERIQKILARAGLASRRGAEQLIAQGSVTVNGKPVKLGDQAEYGKDSIKVDGKLLHSTEPISYLAFHKPKGVISMFGDPEGRPSISDYMTTVKQRLFPVGRLDFNSSGLILLTNDGPFAEKLQRRPDILRVYHVKIGKHPSPEDISRLERGGRAGERMFRPHAVRITQEFTKKTLIEVSVMGAGAVDLKTYFESKGILVEKITRVAFGHLRIDGIEEGRFKFLKPSQVNALLEQPELGLRRQDFEAKKAEKKLAPRNEREERPAKHAIITPVSGRPVSGKSLSSRAARPGARIAPVRGAGKPADRSAPRPAIKPLGRTQRRK